MGWNPKPDTNLLEETVETLKEFGHSVNDVLWVGTGIWYMSWDEFSKKADNMYYSGYGGQEVNSHLVVVGDGWWLERSEYDGSEWWEYKRPPVKPDNYDPAAWVMPERSGA